MLRNVDWLQHDEQPPAELLPWLTHSESLTEKLVKRTSMPVQLQVLSQQWGAVDSWEKTTLAIQEDRILRREILMLAGGKPCWYARTLIPHTVYEVAPEKFSRLAHESLGQIIFSDAAIHRVLLGYYPIIATSHESWWLRGVASESTDRHWVRFSEISVFSQYQFYLIEILLPELARYY